MHPSTIPLACPTGTFQPLILPAVFQPDAIQRRIIPPQQMLSDRGMSTSTCHNTNAIWPVCLIIKEGGFIWFLPFFLLNVYFVCPACSHFKVVKNCCFVSDFSVRHLMCAHLFPLITSDPDVWDHFIRSLIMHRGLFLSRTNGPGDLN